MRDENVQVRISSHPVSFKKADGCLAVGGAAFFVRDSLGFFGDLDMEQDARCCWPPPEWCIRCFLYYEPVFFNFILPFLLFSLFRVYFEQLLKV